uniref:Uncharacterized protein n=1 Tax=Avena sativa TaxID=4498 RepID=A0ACD6ADG0_AVESA
MYFAKLDDSPMFRTQIQSLEESAEILRERCLKFHKVSWQVEHMLNDRLLNFADVDLHDVKDARKRFDKASLVYDQVREKYLSLKKGTRADITTAIEEELHSARSSFEQARFNLVTAISHIEAKKRFEFLEAVSATMDSHLRYFKQGYELLHQMEPYINQVLAYSQQSRERANKEQASLVERMHEYKKQIDRESRSSANGLNDSLNVDGIQTIGRSSHKMIEAVMQSSSKGKVQTIRQGYLSKRSSNLRGDWKRRFFVLDSRGMLYYYRKQITRPPAVCPPQRTANAPEHGSGLLSRLFSSHYHACQYADKEFVRRHSIDEIHVAQQMWDNVTVNDKKGVYSLIVASHANVNLIYGQMASGLSLNLGKALLQEQPASPPDGSPRFFDCDSQEKVSSKEPITPASTSSHVDELDDRYEGFSLLHLACRVADVGMVELLLQYGASVNVSDSRGRTALHHCILRGRHLHAKLLLSRGANSHATDRDGRSAFQYAMDRSTSDEGMLMLLDEHFR